MDNIEKKINNLKNELDRIRKQAAQLEYQKERAKLEFSESVSVLKNSFKVDTLEDAYKLLGDNESKLKSYITEIESLIRGK